MLWLERTGRSQNLHRVRLTGDTTLTQILKLVRLTLIFCSCAQTLFASDEDRTITALYGESKIIIDGILDEREWSLVDPATDFIQNEPNMGEPASERTEVR